MEFKIDVTISEDLSSSTGYNTVKSKVHIAVSIKRYKYISVCLPTFCLLYFRNHSLYNMG